MPALNIKVKLFDKSLPMPIKHTKGSAAFDLYARISLSIAPKSIGYVPLNVALSLPPGYWTLLAARSSLHKLGLWPAHGIGVIDNDYSGDDDELILPVYNFSDRVVNIDNGQRLAQAIIMPDLEINLVQVEAMGLPNRGKFGSTGK